jgi:flavin reductase (DIM6/NTAB) family NADH-FMN oxidoreductase RutF
MAAPTAVNKQPWHFVVVTDKNVLSAISEATPNASMAAKAPLAIVVCGDMNKALEGGGRDFWVQDASAATENILLAAHALGLGAVWTGTYPNQERCAKIAKLLHLPQNLVPLNTIVIGYPAENPTPKDKWNPQNVSYNYFGNVAGTSESALNAEEKDEFHTFNVETDFHENPFQIGTGKGLILCAGDKSKSNAMTIGWIGLGTLWGHNDAITVYVAQKRYTHDFMEHAMYFTIMSFDKEHENVLDYMGNHSGRDGDKAKALGLHTLYTQHGTPYYAEANMVIECEMMYAAPFDKNGFREIPRKLYSNFPAGVHSVYIGRVVQAMKK